MSNMKDNELRQLLNHWLDGSSTLEQEERLRRRFLSGKVPADLEKYRPLFGYVAQERAAAGVAAGDGRMPFRRRLLRTVVSVTAAAAVLAGAGVLVFDGGRFQGGASGLRLTVGGRSVADEALAVEIVDRELARLGDVQAAFDLSLDVLREAARVRDSTMSVLEDRMVLDFKIK